jgi:hypothetical protein
LHWVRDVVFHDDLARFRTANGPHNMAIIKHIAMNLVRNPKDSHSLKNRRKLANLNQDYLARLISQTENQPEAIPMNDWLQLRASSRRKSAIGAANRIADDLLGGPGLQKDEE